MTNSPRQATGLLAPFFTITLSPFAGARGSISAQFTRDLDRHVVTFANYNAILQDVTMVVFRVISAPQDGNTNVLLLRAVANYPSATNGLNNVEVSARLRSLKICVINGHLSTVQRFLEI